MKNTLVPALAVALFLVMGANSQTSTTAPITAIAGSWGNVVQVDSGHTYVLDAYGVRYNKTTASGIQRADGTLVASYVDLQDDPICYPFGESTTDLVVVGGLAYFQACDYFSGAADLWQVGSTKGSLVLLTEEGSSVTVDGKPMAFYGGFKPLNVSGQLVEIGYWGNTMKAVAYTTTGLHVVADYGSNYVVDAAASNGCILAITTADPLSPGSVQRTCGNTTTTVGSIPNLGLDENWNLTGYSFSVAASTTRTYWLFQNAGGGLTTSNIGDTESTATVMVLGALIGSSPVSNIWDLKVGGDGTTAFVMELATQDGLSTAGGFTIGQNGTTTLQMQPPFGSVGLYVFGGQIFAHSGDGHLSWLF